MKRMMTAAAVLALMAGAAHAQPGPQGDQDSGRHGGWQAKPSEKSGRLWRRARLGLTRQRSILSHKQAFRGGLGKSADNS